MEDYKSILKRVGWVLIIVGIIDIGFMFYAFANWHSYSSSLNIFAVIAGIFLLRGSLKAARTISLFVAMYVSGFIGLLLLGPWLIPFGLILTVFKLNTITTVMAFAAFAILFALSIWTYRSLTSTPVVRAIEQTGVDLKSFWKKPSFGFWLGIIAVTFGFIAMFAMTHGETAEEVKSRAEEQVGQGYEYFIIQMSMSSNSRGKYVRASVVAYNDNEIKQVQVAWSE